MADTIGITIGHEQVAGLELHVRGLITRYGTGSGLQLHGFSGAVNGSNAEYVLDQAPADAALLWIFWNGMKQPAGSFSLSGASVFLSPAPKPGDTLEFYF